MEEQLPLWEQGVRQGGEMDKVTMAKNLLDFKEVMDKHQMPFVLFAGCLLGVIRQEGFIKKDTDVDVACFYHTQKPFEEVKYYNSMADIKADLTALGFTIVGKDITPWNWDVFIRNGEKIEIWWFQKIDDEYIFSNNIRYPSHYFDLLDEVDFLDTKFKIPSDHRDFLELTYGIDWRTPIEKTATTGWAFDLNPKAVEKRKRIEEYKIAMRQVIEENKRKK
jgi:hypothetical protein